jgi:predicted oxidoreductase
MLYRCDMSILPNISRTQSLGTSDITISSIAWGHWRLVGHDVANVTKACRTAINAGITLFDTADIYGTSESHFGAAEELFGAVLSENPDMRDHIVLATKGGIFPGVPYDSSAAYLNAAIDASLSRLQTDRIDLWQIHRPDMLTHPQEIARVVEDAVQAGKIRAFGVSNYTQSQIATLAHFLTVPLATIQPELSALCIDTIEDGMLDQAMMMDFTVLAWSPLGGGRIADPQTQRERDVAAALSGIAAAHGVSRTTAALSWIMAHPARPVPIIGTQNPVRIAEAAAAFTVQWSRADWYGVLVAARGIALP